MFGDLDTLRLSQVLAGLQQNIHYRVRPAVAQSLADATNRVLPDAVRVPRLPQTDSRLAQLRARGLVELGPVLDGGQTEVVLSYFDTRPCYAAHVAGKSDGVGRTIEGCATLGHYGSYRLEDVLRAPHLIEIANREDILSLVESYLGCPPTLYSVNAFWSFPGQTQPWPGIQTFHRDFDDWRFCTMFIFLTPLTAENGAHYYIPGTHRVDIVEKAYAEKGGAGSLPFTLDAMFAENADLNDACARLFADRVQTVAAPAGNAVIEDTYGLHKGDIPKSRRLLVWIRYGLYKNLANQRDALLPLPADALQGRIPATVRHRFVNRLMVAPM